MPNKIEDVYNTKVVLDYSQSIVREPSNIDVLFPVKKIDDIELDMIIGGNGTPVAASVHDWDTETEIGEREGVKIATQELAVVKRKIKLSGKEAIKLRKPRDNAELQATIKRLLDDAGSMVNTVLTRFEAMCFEVLATGKLAFSENGYSGTVDYHVPANHKEVAAKPWSDPTSDPLRDLKKWQSKIKADTGFTPKRVLTSERIAGLIEDHEKVRLAINGNKDKFVTRTELNEFLAKKGLPTFVTEDRSYRTKVKGKLVAKRFFDEDTLSLFPEGRLGEMVYGLTEEEILLSEKNDYDLTKVGNVVTTVEFVADPPARWTKAAAVGLPTFPTAEQVYIVTGLLGAEG